MVVILVIVGTIDISNVTDLSEWYNEDGTFTLEGGSIFILPKSISTRKIGSTGNTFNDIQLNSSNNITYTKGSSSTVKGGNVRCSIITKGCKIVFK